jgi:hypothetical protein
MTARIIEEIDGKGRKISYEINFHKNAIYAYVADEELKNQGQAEEEARKQIGHLQVETEFLSTEPGEEGINQLQALKVKKEHFRKAGIATKMLELAVEKRNLGLNIVPDSLQASNREVWERFIARALDKDVLSSNMLHFDGIGYESSLVEKALDRYNRRHNIELSDDNLSEPGSDETINTNINSLNFLGYFSDSDSNSESNSDSNEPSSSPNFIY